MSAMHFSAPLSQIPPTHEAFKEILAMIPRVIEAFGARRASILVADVATRFYVAVRHAYEGDRDVVERMIALGLTEADCLECADWLQRRARELRGDLH